MVEQNSTPTPENANPDDKIQALKKTMLFRPLEDLDLSKVGELLQEEDYLQGKVLFRINEEADSMYFIKQGEITASYGSKPPFRPIATFKEGDYFGEMAMLSDNLRSANAVVTSETASLLILQKEAFERMLASNLRMMRQFVGLMSRRLAETATQYPKMIDTEDLLLEAIKNAGFKAIPEFDDEDNPNSLRGFRLEKDNTEANPNNP